MLIRDWSSYVVSSDRVRRAFPRARRAVFRGASRRRPRRADRRRRAARDGVAPPSELGLCPRRGPDSGDDRIYRLPLGDAVRLVFLRRAGDATDARRRTADRRRLPDRRAQDPARRPDRTRSEEHTSELQSLMRISYAVFCLKKKNNKKVYKKAI